MTAIMPKAEVQKLLDEVSDSRHWVKSGRALKEMQNAAPNLARSLIAAHDEIERLRAERDAASALAATAYGASLDWEEILEGDALWFAQDDIAKSRVACIAAEAERDRLAADNARLAAQVEALTGALKEAGDYLEACKVNGLPDLGAASRMPFLDDVIANVDAALTLDAMTAIMPKDEVQKLLTRYDLPIDCDCNDDDCVKCSHYPTFQMAAAATLKGIAPDLARSLMAAHDEMERLAADNARLVAQVRALTGAGQALCDQAAHVMIGAMIGKYDITESAKCLKEPVDAWSESATLAAMTPAEQGEPR